MDDLDRALIEAYSRVWARCVADPAEARRRWLAARQSVTWRRPVRGWCLGIRAGDTRISSAYGLGKYERLSREVGKDAGCGVCDIHEDDAAHVVGLGVEDVLEWCGPVRITWPGVPIEEAAARLGRHVETLRRWLPPEARQGRERADRIARGIAKQRDYEDRRVKDKGKVGAGHFRGWGVRYESPRLHGKRRGVAGEGAATPVVWCDRPIDPGHQGGVPPAPAWGCLWEQMAERFAAAWYGDDVLTAWREGRWVARRRTVHGPAVKEFRGWVWRCPGLAGVGKYEAEKTKAGGEPGRADPDRGDTPRLTGVGGYTGCGRRVGVLVCPLPMGWSVAGWLSDRAGYREGLDVGEAARWFPGRGLGLLEVGSDGNGLGDCGVRPPMAAPALYGGRLGFACVECWKVRSGAAEGRGQWNDFVRRASGGLLSGKDVGWLAR